jgi:hypothetical protein
MGSQENRHYNLALQPDFWPDPERNLVRLHKKSNSRYSRRENDIINEEVKFKRKELRGRIGLPVARGKNPHVNDDFYKFLVRRICVYDTFGIFVEYDRVISEVPEELDSKINKVAGLVDELLNKGLNRPQRFNRYYQFVREYQEKENSRGGKTAP